MEKNRSLSNDEIERWYALDLPEISPPIFAHSFALFSVGFIFVGLFYSAFVEVPMTIEVQGKLILENPSIPVRASQSMTVNRNELEENKIVNSGDVLVTSTYGVSPDYINELNTLSKKIDKLNENKVVCLDCLSEIYDWVQKIDSLKERRQITDLVEYLKIQRNDVFAFKSAYAKYGIDMQKTYSEIAKIDSYMTKNKRDIASVLTEKQKKDLMKKKAELMRLYAEFQNSFEPLNGQYDQFKKKLEEQNRISKLKLIELESKESVRAPISGKVINVKIKGAGEYVGPGQPLFEIVPLKNDLIVMMEVQNKDISAIKLGSSIDIIFDAFPEYDFGKVTANVTKILEPENNDGQQQQQRGFRIQAKLDKRSLVLKNDKFQLLNGMTLKARVYKDKETMLMSFFKTVFKLKDNIKS